MDEKIYTFHTDPGHGWLEVEIEELKRLGIADKITVCSYISGNMAYLEEDCDASTFLEEKRRRNEKFYIREAYKEHTPIRHYNSYSMRYFNE